MPQITTRGLSVHYRQAGDGPDVVLVHGIAGNMAMWYLCGLVTELTKRFRVTCYDLRGHGYSDDVQQGYTSLDMAEDLRSLIESLGVESPLVVGHSFGARIATHLAAVYPREVGGLLISDANFPGLSHLQQDADRWPGWQRYQRRAAEFGVEVSELAWLDVKELFEQVANFSPVMQSRFVEAFGEATLKRILRNASSTCSLDVGRVAGLTEQRIRTVRQPVVCIYGENSPFLPTSDFLAANLAECRVELIPDAEHFAFEENPDVFVEVVVQNLCTLADIAAPDRRMPMPRYRRMETMMTEASVPSQD